MTITTDSYSSCPSVFFSIFTSPPLFLNSLWEDLYCRSLHSGFKCNSLYEVFLLQRTSHQGGGAAVLGYIPKWAKRGRSSSAEKGYLCLLLVHDGWSWGRGFAFEFRTFLPKGKKSELEMIVNGNLKENLFFSLKTISAL